MHRFGSLSLLFLLACTTPLPPAMSPAASTPAAADARLSFVRPASRCDTGDYAIVVDDAGHFVGNLAPGTKLTVPLSAGSHVYYTWSSRDLRTEAYPDFNPVSAFRVNAEAGGDYRVALLVVERDTGIGHCNHYAIVRFHPIVPGGPYSADVAEWLQTTQPVVADRDAGQAALESDPTTLRDYMAFGRAAMARADARAH